MHEPIGEKVFVKALPETDIKLSEETPEYIMVSVLTICV